MCITSGPDNTHLLFRASEGCNLFRFLAQGQNQINQICFVLKKIERGQ